MDLKKIALTSVFFIISSTYTFANDFYIGLGAARQFVNFNKRLTIDDQTTGDNLFYKNDNQPGRGYAANGFAGYSREYQNFYLAAEINAALSSLRYHGIFTDLENDEQSEAEYTMPRSYGISLIPGYKVTEDWLLYARVGGVRGNFKYWEYKTTPSTGYVRGVTQWAWLNGFRYGVGMEGLITKNMGLRFEYNQTRYQTFTNSFFPGFPGQNRVIKFSPTMDQVELDLIYRFG